MSKEENTGQRPVSLVTGGAGFIGAHVTRELVKLGNEVIVLDDLSGGFIDNLPEGVHFIQGSVTDQSLVESLFAHHHFTYVYHLAAYAAEGLSHFIRKFNYENNLIGSINLINESVKHNVKCFVFTSSIAVYGKGQLPMREDMVPQPEDPYGISKLAVELDLKCAQEMFGLNYVIFRPHNVYGEFQNIGDKYRNVVGIFMNQLMQGKSLSIFGDGLQTRAFSYIGDMAPHIANCVNVNAAINETINVGADKDYNVKELAEIVCEVMGMKGQLQFLEARNEVVHAYSDHSKARHIFGDSLQTSLQVGIHKMAAWAQASGVRENSKFGKIEIEKNLPPFWTK